MLAAGALGGFILSRTVGVFGFVERGLQPSPQAIASILLEIATLLTLAVPIAGHRWPVRSVIGQHRPAG
ncbi:hypothetical protein [Frankia sp. Cas4]|uniref:hypothetical protein n=1 Tax=Frankia sp. Cas4 TaxID=3073927 RepID=UPI002AD20F64|nr:hypothetical protein [Frankia sp. Cas4]